MYIHINKIYNLPQHLHYGYNLIWNNYCKSIRAIPLYRPHGNELKH